MAQKHKLEQTPQIPESSRTSTLRALHNAHDGSERPMAPINSTYTSETTHEVIRELVIERQVIGITQYDLQSNASIDDRMAGFWRCG